MSALETAPAPEYLSVQEVSVYTGLSVDFWNRLRGQQGGCPYVKLSAKAVRYRKADVDAWMAQRLRRSTFDDRPPEAANDVDGGAR